MTTVEHDTQKSTLRKLYTLLTLILGCLVVGAMSRVPWGDQSSTSSSGHGSESSGETISSVEDNVPFTGENIWQSEDAEEPPVFDALSAMFEGMGDLFANEVFMEELRTAVEAVADAEPEFQGFVGNIDDMLDALGSFFPQEQLGKPDFQYPPFPPVDVPPAPQRSIHSQMSQRDRGSKIAYRGENLTLVAQDSKLLIIGSDFEPYVVGRCSSSLKFSAPVSSHSAFDDAAALSEDTKAKNTGLGFSSFVHLLAQMIICKTFEPSVYEPVTGGDVETMHGVFEIKGHGWQHSSAPCDVMVSKYRLVMSCMPHTQTLLQIVEFSEKEDAGDTSLFQGTAFDQGRSPYTPVCDRLHLVTDLVDTYQKARLVDSMKSWISRKPPIPDIAKETLDAAAMIESFLVKKRTEGELKTELLPSPYRVIAPDENVDVEIMKQIAVKPYIGSEYVGSTYRTCTYADHITTDWIGAAPFAIKTPMDDPEKPTHWLFQQLCGLDCIQSSYIESELEGKVWGPAGCFYSEYCRVGICWKRIRANSNVYFASYYSHAMPPSEKKFGKWRAVPQPGSDLVIYQGPTFKMNTSDQAFAALVPYRFCTQIFAMLAYMRVAERPYIVSQTLKLSLIVCNSSWRTSRFSGNQRFLTLCRIAESGDPVSMVKSALDDPGDKPLTSADVAYLVLLRNSFIRHPVVGPRKTPLLQLPIRFLSIEKDLPLMLMWHIRGQEHDTRCLTKMLKSAVDEQVNRAEYVGFLERQADYLEKMVTSGTTQYEFDSLFDSKPDFVCYNHVLMMICSFMSAPTVKQTAEQREWGTNVSITEMITDHNSQELKPPRTFGPQTVIQNTKMHTGLRRVLDELGSPRCIHELLVKQASGEKIPFVYGMHAKDAKSSDREISQMIADMRPQQCYSEGACAVYSDAEECDMMLNHDKPAEFTKTFSKVIEKKGKTTSEDKEFYCGKLLPEGMALSTHAVARDTGSTMLISSAGLQRIDTERWIVFPIAADPSIIPPSLETRDIIRVEHKQRKVVKAVKLHIHMQQGIRALGGAVHATVFSKGMQLLMQEMSAEFGEAFLMTTSDDAVRGRIPPDNAAMNIDSTDREFFYRPLIMMEHAMMKNSMKKFMEFRVLCEFNNMVVNMHGMIPQQFVHAHLAIQPLLGQSLATDIITAVSSARSTLMWGDSLDLATCAYDCYLVLIKQKWLLTDHEADLLTSSGFLPSSDEELIAGFALRDKRIIQNVWNMMDEESKASVLKGEVSFNSVMSSFKLARGEEERKKKKTKIKREKPIMTPHFLLARKSRSILASRVHRQGLSKKYVKPIDPRKRIAAKNKLMVALMTDSPDIADDVFDKIVSITEAPKVVIEPRKIKPQHMQPQKQGTGGSSTIAEDLHVVLAKRNAGINLRRMPTTAEVELAGRTDEDLLEWMTRRERRDEFRTLGFTSATGLPRFMRLNDVLLEFPMSFSYTVERDHTDVIPTEFSYRVNNYPNFEVVIIGERVLDLARREKSIIAFGRARSGEDIHFFYMPHGESVEMLTVKDDGRAYHVRRLGNRSVLCLVKNDKTAINATRYLPTNTPLPQHVAILAGDPVAMLNYGNYLNTRSRTALNMMSGILSRFGTARPRSIGRFLPTYPNFLDDAVAIPRARSNILVGYRSARKLKLTMPSGEISPCQRIDLTSDLPSIIHDVEESFSDGDEWE